MQHIATTALLAILAACAGSLPPADRQPPQPREPAAVTPTEPTVPSAAATPVTAATTAAATKVEPKAPMDDATTANDVAIVAIDSFIAKQSIDISSATWRTTLVAPPLLQFDAKRDYFWHIETSLGVIKLQLFPDTAPHHVTGAIYLARIGFYDDLIFHRIIKGFMAQGGCPLRDGRGTPGFALQGEFAGNRKHDKPGVLSTANAGPGTDGSQFFLTFARTPHLDGVYTIYGEVVDGMATLQLLEKADSPTPDNAPRIVRTWVSAAPKRAP